MARLTLFQTLVAVARTEPAAACVELDAARNRWGYASVRRDGRMELAHRAAWEVVNGPIPAGMTVDHLCFNPACVNIAHLRLLTPSENARRQRAVTATTCRRGHPYDEQNTYRRPRVGDGRQRICRKCNSLAAQRYKQRRAS